MIVKFFTHGTGGSKGVFDYLLKDKEQPDGKRLDAEVLRGDIDNQALLIDSLDFKQKYTSGCLSFTESADQVTQAQKEQLMDSFEETIRAGLDVDSVSVSWIEHRDKGRLELNFVFANVDLVHGRAFQPYVHNVDKRRVNAWKDMQNIEHGFSDPNDPTNKRLMGQRDNLPRDIKDARQAITDGLQALVKEGAITSRADVVQSLTDSGFEIARQTDKAISIKNPDPKAKRNIRLTGGLYERDFNFSAEVQSTVTAASEDYRARSTERYSAAKQLYDSEIARKRDYHQARHGKPKREQRAATADIRQESTRYSYSPYNVYQESPSPYRPRFKQTRQRESDNDSGLRTAHYTADRTKRERHSASHQVKNRQVGNNRRDSVISRIYTRDYVGSKNERSSDLQVLSRQQERSNVYATAKGLKDGQTAIRPSTASAASTAGHDQTSSADARRQRQRYSRIDSIIEEVGTSANTASKGLAELARAVTDQNQRTDKRTEWLGKSSQSLRRHNETLNNRVNNTLQCTDSTHRAYADVSEYDSSARQSKQRDERIRDDINQSKELTDYNQDYAERNKQFAEYNRQDTAELNRGIKAVREIKQEIKQEIKLANTRSSSPRMGW